jgi:hypothetical protein
MKEQEMTKKPKEKQPEQQKEQQPVLSTISAALVHRDQLVAELKAEFPNITDEELEAYGV